MIGVERNLIKPKALKKGDTIGEVNYLIGEKNVAKVPLVAAFDVNKAKYSHMLKYIFRSYFKPY